MDTDNETQNGSPVAQTGSEKNLEQAPDRVEETPKEQEDVAESSSEARRSNEDPSAGHPGDLSGQWTSTENPGGQEGDLSDQTGRDN